MANSLQTALAKGQVMAPDVFDGISTRAAVVLGCHAGLLSASAISHTVHGMPDDGTLSASEMLWVVSRQVACTGIPLIADVRNGYGEHSDRIQVELERIVKTGVSAILLDDRAWGCGIDSNELTLVSEAFFAQKIQSARRAVSGTDCMVLARSFAPDLDEAIVRCAAARQAGADLVGAAAAKTAVHAEKLAQTVSGLKLWNDLTATGDTPDVALEQLAALEFGLVFLTFMEKGAWFGDLDYGKKNFENGNTVYADMHDFDGMLTVDGKLHDYHEIFSYWKTWMPIEMEAMDLSAVYGGKVK